MSYFIPYTSPSPKFCLTFLDLSFNRYFFHSVAMSCLWQVTWIVPLSPAYAVQCLLLSDGCGVAVNPPAKLCAHVCDVIARGDPLFSPLARLTALQLGRVSVRLCVGALFIWGEGALRVSCLALTGSHLSVAVRAAAVSICERSCTASMCSACWILERLHSHPQAFWRGHRVFSHTDLSFYSLSPFLSLSFSSPSLLLSHCQLIKASDQV